MQGVSGMKPEQRLSSSENFIPTMLSPVLSSHINFNALCLIRERLYSDMFPPGARWQLLKYKSLQRIAGFRANSSNRK